MFVVDRVPAPVQKTAGTVVVTTTSDSTTTTMIDGGANAEAASAELTPFDLLNPGLIDLLRLGTVILIAYLAGAIVLRVVLSRYDVKFGGFLEFSDALILTTQVTENTLTALKERIDAVAADARDAAETLFDETTEGVDNLNRQMIRLENATKRTVETLSDQVQTLREAYAELLSRSD